VWCRQSYFKEVFTKLSYRSLTISIRMEQRYSIFARPAHAQESLAGFAAR
jgi:hypothetical protein